MPNIKIDGVSSGVDGEYELDFEDAFDGDELHLIKVHAGVRVGEISEAMDAGDYDVIVALAKIAADRAGVAVTLPQLMALKVGGITMAPTAAEEEADAEEAELPPPNAPSGATAPDSEADTSGPSSSNGLESLPASGLPGIGAPA